tara:strand:+ start:300 stop:554 length:255 start_codon:yes stop_codon:yes gene_type:complete
MAIEAEDLIANAKSDLSQSIVLLLRRRSFYKDVKRPSKYKETNVQIATLRKALNALDENSKEKVLPPKPKRIPHPSKWGNQVFS